VLDTNACLTYAINVPYSGSRGRMHIRRAASMETRQYVDAAVRNRTLLICAKVNNEVASKAWDALVEAARRAGLTNLIALRVVLDRVLKNLDGLIKKAKLTADDTSELGRVQKMYSSIWADPAKAAKRRKWASVKRLPPGSGPPAGADHVILSTAAALASSNDVEFLTFDHDFIIFREEILQELRVAVVNGYDLAR
jgi:hypothetical protein